MIIYFESTISHAHTSASAHSLKIDDSVIWEWALPSYVFLPSCLHRLVKVLLEWGYLQSEKVAGLWKHCFCTLYKTYEIWNWVFL